MTEIAIGVPTYNGAHRVAELFRSIHMRTPELDGDRVRIVLVDDGSPKVQETRDVFSTWKSLLPLTFIEHGHNRGISAGWNTATRATDAPLVVLVNDDVIVSMGWLDPLLHVLRHSPKVGVVGQSWHGFKDADVPQLLESPLSDAGVIPREPFGAQAPERRKQFEDNNPGRVMAPTGQLFAFRRSDFDEIGGFDECYLSFHEETCFGTSMAAKGLIGVQTCWPFCFHRWSATFTASPELRGDVRMAQSRLRYSEKWGVPEHMRGAPCDYTNPKHLGAIPDVEVEFIRKGGAIERGVLRQDGAYVDGKIVG